jgi:regulator of cell morphogenesis and NO signaling
MRETLVNATIGDIVAGDFRTAGVFERFGIDFCCGGRKSLVEACRKAAADPDAVVRELEALPAAEHTDDDAANWPPNRLVDYIESTHHVYVRAALPRITGFIAKLVEVHGVRHPELPLIGAAFGSLAGDLAQHLLKEGQVLFPYVRDLADHAEQLCGGLLSPFGSVQNPIRMMEREHRDAGDQLQMIRELTRGYTTPADGCATYAVCMAELQEFERDLHRHIHLENNVLFPKAIALENGSWRYDGR